MQAVSSATDSQKKKNGQVPMINRFYKYLHRPLTITLTNLRIVYY